MPIYRAINTGAVVAERLDNIAELRRRYTVTGNPTLIATARGPALRVSTNNNITAMFKAGQFPHGTTGDFSVSLRIKTTDDSHAVLGNKRIDSDLPGFSVRIGSGEIILKVGYTTDYAEITSATEINDDVWHTVTFTVDRDGNSYVYIDGTPEGETANFADGEDITSALDLAIGCDALGNFDMDGDLQDVMVRNRMLTQQEAEYIASDGVF